MTSQGEKKMLLILRYEALDLVVSSSGKMWQQTTASDARFDVSVKSKYS